MGVCFMVSQLRCHGLSFDQFEKYKIMDESLLSEIIITHKFDWMVNAINYLIKIELFNFMTSIHLPITFMR